MLLECLDAQGTFLQQSTFYSIGLPYEADEERGIESERGEGMGAERERGCKKIQVSYNLLFFSFSFKLLTMQTSNVYIQYSIPHRLPQESKERNK